MNGSCHAPASSICSFSELMRHLQVALYCCEGDEAALLAYLRSARDPLGVPLYDSQVALRLARRHGHRHACVELLWELQLYEVGADVMPFVFCGYGTPVLETANGRGLCAVPAGGSSPRTGV